LERSPGGTPLKSSGSNHSSTLDLTDVLKRRYQAWHSPTPSEKDYGEKENFDENAFDDSFFVEEVKTAFKPDLKYSGRNKMSARSSTEKSVPVSTVYLYYPSPFQDVTLNLDKFD
jgi:hypothetical protein